MRIVSLCPSITESLVALGLRDELAGITRYCIHPKEALAGIPRVGGTKNPDLAAIRALAPDLVFMNAEENRAEDVEALRAEFAVDLSHPRRVADVPELLRHFGERTRRTAEAETWAARIEEALASFRAGGSREPFRYVYLIWKSPWMIAGEGTYIADLLALAGGRPALGPRDAYPEVTEEEIVRSAPDVLLLPDEPYRFGEKDRSFWEARLPSAAVRLVSGDDYCWHGVRTLRGIEASRELAGSRTLSRLR